jgi:hypothetical protein
MESENQIQFNAEMKLKTAILLKDERVQHPDEKLFWYSAETKYGSVYVGLLQEQSDSATLRFYKSTVLENILALSREEKMIQLLEDWLKVGLDLRPARSIVGEYYTFKLSDRNRVANNTTNKIIVKLDFQTLHNAPVPSWQAETSLYLTSNDVSVNLILSNNTIDIDYEKTLQENSILMIPESFSHGWIGYARNRHITSRNIPIDIGENLQTFSMNNEIQIPSSIDNNSVNESRNYLNISVDEGVMLPFHFLLGWANTGSYIITKPLFFYPISINRGNTAVATGRLVSISNGYGIHIKEVL